MSTISKPNTFSPNTTISSSAVNANFDTIYNDYNGGIAAANLAANAISTAKIADSAVTTAKINDAAVTNQKLAVYTASTTYAPTWTGSTTSPVIGNGSITAYYQQIGKWVKVRIYILLGSTSTVGSGTYTLSLPVTATSNITAGKTLAGTLYSNDIGVASYMGAIYLASTTTISAFVPNGSTDTRLVQWSATKPIAPGNGDEYSLFFEYEAA